MLRISLMACAMLLAGCQSAPAGKTAAASARTINGMAVTGGDGSSLAKAVVIDARSASAGVPAEYAWIRETYPGSKPDGTSLIAGKGGKYYDAIYVITAEGEKVTVYFDITRYMGKF